MTIYRQTNKLGVRENSLKDAYHLGLKRTAANKQGFTLIEMLLVLVIVSVLVWASMGYMLQRAEQMRIDRTSTQMQQILNAGLAFYVANGSWPASIACLQGIGGGVCAGAVYLPNPLASPWSGGAYTVASTPEMFYVFTTVTAGGATSTSAARIANIIAGTLPLSYTTQTTSTPPSAPIACTTGATCRVVGSVNIPGQNINNARSVNFAGLYHHGGCVPVPTCPVDANGNTMTAQVMIVPVSVSGVNDPNSTNVYPISSFTGYARGPAANPPQCSSTGATAVACNAINAQAGATYWRACMQVVTERGDVSVTNTATGTAAWGGDVTLLALTRCSVTNEPSGSPFSVFSR